MRYKHWALCLVVLVGLLVIFCGYFEVGSTLTERFARTYEITPLMQVYTFLAGLVLGILPALEVTAGRRSIKLDWPRLLILGLPALVLGLNMVWFVNLPWRFPGFVMVIYANSRMIQLVSGAVLSYVLLTGLRKKATD